MELLFILFFTNDTDPRSRYGNLSSGSFATGTLRPPLSNLFYIVFAHSKNTITE